MAQDVLDETICVERKAYQSGTQVIIKMADSKIIGTDTDEGLLVDWIWVPMERRGQGVGTALVAAAKKIIGKPVIPGCVLEDAAPFWDQALKQGLSRPAIFQY